MKYKITLNGKTYEVEVEEGQAMLVDEYEAYKPAAPAPAAAPCARGCSPAAPCRSTRCSHGCRRWRSRRGSDARQHSEGQLLPRVRPSRPATFWSCSRP